MLSHTPLNLPLQSQLDHYVAVAQALEGGEGEAHGLPADFLVSHDWLRCGAGAGGGALLEGGWAGRRPPCVPRRSGGTAGQSGAAVSVGRRWHGSARGRPARMPRARANPCARARAPAPPTRRSKWLKRKNKKDMGGQSPTAAITCACGGLAPHGAGKGRVRGPRARGCAAGSRGRLRAASSCCLRLPAGPAAGLLLPTTPRLASPTPPQPFPLNPVRAGQARGGALLTSRPPADHASLAVPAPPSSHPLQAKRVAVPADFWRFLQRGWTAHCAALRAKAAKAAKTAAGGGGGGGDGTSSGVWEVAEDGAKQGGRLQGEPGEPGGAGGQGRAGRGAAPRAGWLAGRPGESSSRSSLAGPPHPAVPRARC